MNYSLRIEIACLLAAVAMLPALAVAQTSSKRSTKEAPVLKEAVPPPAPVPTPTPNGSLFNAESTTNLVVDFKARSVGDLVFVDVVEESDAAVSSKASRSRESGTIAGLAGAIGAIPVPGAAATAGVVTGLGTRKFEGQGQTRRQTNLNARIAARVVEVLPNGDLRIEAEKLVKINKENERLALTGIVRTRDLSGDNAIPSTFVGDLKVSLNGKGVASADNEPGWLYRFLDKISPF